VEQVAFVLDVLWVAVGDVMMVMEIASDVSVLVVRLVVERFGSHVAVGFAAVVVKDSGFPMVNSVRTIAAGVPDESRSVRPFHSREVVSLGSSL
jgi:hypothetical protein